MKSMKKNYIAGEWLGSDETIDNINPSDISDVIGSYAQADVEQTNLAVEAADHARETWSRSSLQVRSDILDKIGNEILRNSKDLGELLSREEGKTIGEGIGEAIRAGHIFKFFGGEVLRQNGDFFDSIRPGIEVSTFRFPVGVVGLVLPWNFPISIPAWKIAPALAYGNTVVFKPAQLVPASAHALTEIIVKSGIPDGVFNLVMGKGTQVGDTIVNHSKINAVSFTGSVPTGRKVAASAVARMAKVQLEMGGKNPLIVLDDADLDKAVDCAIQGAFYSTGQRCTASSRLIVTDGIHNKFVDGMKARMKDIVVDHALKKETTIGPVVDKRQLQQDLEYLDIGKSEGAVLVCGGERVKRKTEGNFLTPALFVDTHNEMRINREEIFGPIASVIKVKDYDEALAVANDTDFGLSAGIVTTSLK
ncbi:MAG: aldehyde dehydrogenase family protein, partial [Porticoccaceae bacterium]|nr:aldehyde dehydrogenase family protein [Porticoccaceae bacterium]